MLHKKIITLFILQVCFYNFAQSAIKDTVSYNSVLLKLDSLIKTNGKFSDAVFMVEDIFIQRNLNKKNYEKAINDLVLFIKVENHFSKSPLNYKKIDSNTYKINCSIFNTFTTALKTQIDSILISHLPYTYNFDDPQGDHDWTNTFVTKLLVTHKGNCRSLTYLYKILADELGAKCWLALAPNHIYIRNYSKQIGWYNTELTSGTFPTDAWIAATGYVNTDAIRSGVYMDTLSNQQSIGLCIMDLAQGYIKQTNNYTDSFVLKCCNLVLQYHSVNPEALLTKAEALKRMYLKQKEEYNPTAQTTYNEMEQTYITLVKLGYREMPYKTYQKWLKTAKQDREKYQNQRLKATLNKH